jgi:hypothetical protein
VLAIEATKSNKQTEYRLYKFNLERDLGGKDWTDVDGDWDLGGLLRKRQ